MPFDELQESGGRSDLEYDFSVGEILRGGRLIYSLASRLIGQGPSYLDVLRAQVLEMELEEKRGGPLPVMARVEDLVEGLGPRCDHVIVGIRGGGKSALGVFLAQCFADTHGVSAHVAGMPERAARSVGLRRVSSLDEAPEDSITVVDEAGLLAEGMSDRARTKWLRRALATARHSGRSWIFIAQHTSGLDREILRHESAWWFKSSDERASLFGREETAENVARACRTLRGYEGPEWSLLEVGGRSFLTRNPLPVGWSDQVSKCLR